MRPAALIRGPMPKPIWEARSGRFSILAVSSSARTPGRGLAPSSFETVVHQHPVFAEQRGDVGHRAEGDEVEVGEQTLVVPRVRARDR